MVDEHRPTQNYIFPDGRDVNRVTFGGDEFLDAVIEAVSGDDMEKRAWARATVDYEDIVASFVADVRRALRGIREARGLSVEAAAAQVGVSASALARLETGATAKADLKLLARVALLLGVVPKLDFAERGAAATVSIGGLEAEVSYARGFLDTDQPSLAVHGSSAAARADTNNTSAGALSPDHASPANPTALEQRIRDLEARIAAMEKPKTEDGG